MELTIEEFIELLEKREKIDYKEVITTNHKIIWCQSSPNKDVLCAILVNNNKYLGILCVFVADEQNTWDERFIGIGTLSHVLEFLTGKLNFLQQVNRKFKETGLYFKDYLCLPNNKEEHLPRWVCNADDGVDKISIPLINDIH